QATASYQTPVCYTRQPRSYVLVAVPQRTGVCVGQRADLLPHHPAVTIRVLVVDPAVQAADAGFIGGFLQGVPAQGDIGGRRAVLELQRTGGGNVLAEHVIDTVIVVVTVQAGHAVIETVAAA